MDLVKAAREGREAAFLQLFDEHHLPLFRFAYRLTGSVADAEDIVQECFLGAAASGMLVRSRGGHRYEPTSLASCETNQ